MADDVVVLSAVVDHYASRLGHSEGGQEWLARHGIDQALAEDLRIGVSDRTLGYRLPEANRKDGATLRRRLVELGIYRTSGHEHLVGSMVVPVIDGDGKIVGLFGERFGRGHEPLWADGLASGLFHGEALRQEDIILAPTIGDALVLLGAGTHNVVAPGRPGGLSRSDTRLLQAAGVRSVTLLGPSLRPVAENLGNVGIACRVVETPAPLATLLAGSSDLRAAIASLLVPEEDLSSVAQPAESPGLDEPGTTWALPPGEVIESGRAEVSGDAKELHVTFGPLRWRVRSADRAKSPDVLRVALTVSEEASGRFHLDTLDLCQAKARGGFVEAAAAELRSDADVLRRQLGEVLFATEGAVSKSTGTEDAVQMSDEERTDALALLCDPRLCERIVADLGVLGIVGEETNLLVIYLATVSRLSDRPFGVVVQSSTSAGKSTLADAVLKLVPEEDLMSYSAVTGQSLYYLGSGDLSHKVLAIAEEQGASRASYALKLLVSEGQLSIASTGKDPTSGKLRTSTYAVAGPVALVLTTTANEIDPELANRLVVLGVDEDQAQTKAIHVAQRRAATLEGLLDRMRRDAVVGLHRNAQRLIESLPVVIEDAVSLNFPDHAIRHRRDHQKLLSLIVACALLHQHQRKIGTVEVDGRTIRYIEASEADVAIGVRLGSEVLARGGDELAPQTRGLLAGATAHVTAKAKRERRPLDSVSFTRRELREALGYSEHQVRIGLDRLVSLEYLLCVYGGPGRRHAYRLADDVAEPGEPRESARGVREEASQGALAQRTGQTHHPVAGTVAYIQIERDGTNVDVGTDNDRLGA